MKKLNKTNLLKALGFLVCVGVGLFFYWIRPIGVIRGPLMIFWRHPALFTLPFIAGVAGALLYFLVVGVAQTVGKGREKRRAHDHRFGATMSWLAAGLAGLLVTIIWTSAWTSESLYQHTKYGVLTPAMFEGNQARIKPYGVAWNQLATSLNSPTDNINYTNVGRVNGHLVFTTVRTPNGALRSLTHSANGIMVLSAESSTPSVTQNTPETRGVFNYNPGSKFAKNFGWHAHKICYTCDITEIVGVPTPRGPLLVAPYVTWAGNLFVKHPVFGGVFVESTYGAFQQLNAKQAEADPELVAFGGDLFPETLARRIAEAYAYKYGIANKLWTHNGQYDVEANEEDSNFQPYLEYFKDLGMQWVTMLKPSGTTESLGAIIMTSAINGQTRIWFNPQSAPRIGSNMGIEVLTGEPGLGVNFIDYDALEPRPVFLPNHEPQYLVSITPNSETRTTLSAVVNPRNQTLVGVFQANTKGDANLANYLHTGVLPAKDRFNGTGAGYRTGETATPTQQEEG